MASLRIVPDERQSDTLAHANTIAEPRSVRAENAYTVDPGTLLSGKYRVVRTLGRGGMGLVVEAFHLELQIPVAIKLLLPELMEYTEAASRFQREARAVTKLGSQHVARVLDVDTLPSGEPFIVMEYLKGQDLAQVGRESIPLSVAQAVDYIVQACDALSEAHSLGIVHRDIKPANLFLVDRAGADPMIKVLDFGVSKVLTGDTGEVSITHTTTILGSALYMSPEQMRSAKNVDARTDIYGLGACLYEMLARRPPYMAGSFPELCAAVFSGPPMPITEWSPDVPEGLAKVIDKALAHEPEARYADASELVHALAPYAQEATRTRIEAILRRHADHLTLPPLARRRRSLEPVYRSDADEVAPRRGSRWLVAALLVVGLLGGAVALRSRLPWPALRGTNTTGAVDAAGSTGTGAATSGAAASGSAGVATAMATAMAMATASLTTPGATGAVAAAATATTPAGAMASGGATAVTASGGATAVTAPGAPPSASAKASASSAAALSTAAPRDKVPVPEGPPVPGVSSSKPGVALTPPPTAQPPGEPAPPPPATPAPPATHGDLVDRTCYSIQPDGTRTVVPCD